MAVEQAVVMAGAMAAVETEVVAMVGATVVVATVVEAMAAAVAATYPAGQLQRRHEPVALRVAPNDEVLGHHLTQAAEQQVHLASEFESCNVRLSSRPLQGGVRVHPASHLQWRQEPAAPKIVPNNEVLAHWHL